MAFVGADDSLTVAHTLFAEAILIDAAKKNPHWICDNTQNPPFDGRLPKPDAVAMEKFVSRVRLLTGTLGCQVFKPVGGTPPSPLPTISRVEFNLRKATAYEDALSGEFIVLQGSHARKNDVPPESIKKHRDELLRDGVLKDCGDDFIFTMDYAFSSTSAAAGIVTGNSIAGPSAWKTGDGITYRQWKDAAANA